jgi:serine/threonine protein phosphatase PrpC
MRRFLLLAVDVTGCPRAPLRFSRRYVCDERSAHFGRWFAVYDGHGPGGESAAAFASSNLRRLADARAARAGAGGTTALTAALKAAFKDCELDFARHAGCVDTRGGTVALVACVLRDATSASLLLAWAGDAVAVLRRDGHAHRCAGHPTMRFCIAR